MGGTGLFPDSCVARRLRILIRALLAPWTRKKSLVHKTPSVRRTTLEKSKQAATRGLQAAGGAPWSADKLLSHVEILPYP